MSSAEKLRKGAGASVKDNQNQQDILPSPVVEIPRIAGGLDTTYDVIRKDFADMEPVILITPIDNDNEKTDLEKKTRGRRNKNEKSSTKNDESPEPSISTSTSPILKSAVVDSQTEECNKGVPDKEESTGKKKKTVPKKKAKQVDEAEGETGTKDKLATSPKRNKGEPDKEESKGKKKTVVPKKGKQVDEAGGETEINTAASVESTEGKLTTSPKRKGVPDKETSKGKKKKIVPKNEAKEVERKTKTNTAARIQCTEDKLPKRMEVVSDKEASKGKKKNIVLKKTKQIVEAEGETNTAASIQSTEDKLTASPKRNKEVPDKEESKGKKKNVPKKTKPVDEGETETNTAASVQSTEDKLATSPKRNKRMLDKEASKGKQKKIVSKNAKQVDEVEGETEMIRGVQNLDVNQVEFKVPEEKKTVPKRTPLVKKHVESSSRETRSQTQAKKINPNDNATETADEITPVTKSKRGTKTHS